MADNDIFTLDDGLVKRLQVDGQINFDITLYSDKDEIKDVEQSFLMTMMNK
jgi:hypothetical protein